jgi:hypothetical protein
MTPEQRLDRVERILTLFVREGRRARTRSREQDERINILIKSHLETEEIMKGLAVGQARLNYAMAELADSQERLSEEMAKLAKSQTRTEEVLRSHMNSPHKGHNGDSSN